MDELYEAMDWLLQRQERIEGELADRHLGEGSQVAYDITSSYYEGHTCPLAHRGHNRDGKKGKSSIVYGLLTDRIVKPTVRRWRWPRLPPGMAGLVSAPSDTGAMPQRNPGVWGRAPEAIYPPTDSAEEPELRTAKLWRFHSEFAIRHSVSYPHYFFYGRCTGEELIPSYEPPFARVCESLAGWKVKALGGA